jgi:GT2 family glycosyltransferase
MISIVVLTHNRVHLLRQCVENVLQRTSSATTEIVIWDNASADGTRDYLEGLKDPRIQRANHPENIGQNAYARAFRLTTQPYMIELDDDMVEAPPNWDETLLTAFRRLPHIGYLSANLADDPLDSAALFARYLREERKAYTPVEIDGIKLLEGPTGGGCTMTSRQIYDRAGGFREHPKYVYWREDAQYVKDIRKLGYTSAILADLEVRHAGGLHYSEAPEPKLEHHRREWKREERKDQIKRLILRVPLAARLNVHYDWFDPPARDEFRAWLAEERPELYGDRAGRKGRELEER